jgi:hypothetical protein
MFGIRPGQVVTGAPFAATATSTSSHTLADGNTITRNSAAKLYRDGQGRFRADITTTGSGTSAQSVTHITIFDPVAGFMAQLDPATSTAVTMTLPSNPRSSPPNPPQGPGTAQTVDLGTKTILGLTATGVQTTITIPAGTFGNAQPIQIVRVVWTSTDLQIPVQVTVTDPQRGNSSMQLTAVTRGEPDASLFQIPANYTVTTRTMGPPPGRGE